MKNTTKNLIVGLVIGAVALYFWNKNKQKNEIIVEEGTINGEPIETSSSGNVINTDRSVTEYLQVNDMCAFLPEFKDALNLFIGTDMYDDNDIYTPDFRDALKDKVLKNTTHFFGENDSLNKMFLFDIAKTVSNIEESEMPPRPVNFTYTPGIISGGDKSKEVSDLQDLVNVLYFLKFPSEEVTITINGTYDRATIDAVNELFKGTSALIDPQKGAISKEFVNNFLLILDNCRENLVIDKTLDNY
jgi:hypothetical protein